MRTIFKVVIHYVVLGVTALKIVYIMKTGFVIMQNANYLIGILAKQYYFCPPFCLKSYFVFLWKLLKSVELIDNL